MNTRGLRAIVEDLPRKRNRRRVLAYSASTRQAYEITGWRKGRVDVLGIPGTGEKVILLMISPTPTREEVHVK